MSKSEKITGVSSATTKPSADSAEPGNDAGTREARISEAAFFRAAARGFESGHEWEDWLAAEKEIDAQTKGAASEGTSGAALRPDPNSRIWSS
jgi:hypothetical protein